MGLRIIYLIAAVSLIASCTKTSIPETAGDSHQIVVSIADSQIDTKSTVNIVGDRGKTSFSPGDVLKVYDSNGDDAEYIYKSQRSGAGGVEFVFQKQIGEEIDTTKIETACYPVSAWKYYNKTKKGVITFGIAFNYEQKYTKDGIMQNISAPMVCFKPVDNKLVFSNLSCLLKIGIKCTTKPDNDIKIDKINVTSVGENYLDNIYKFSSNGTVTQFEEGEECSISLVGCASAGAISTDIKYFYITLPPIFDDVLFEEDTDKFQVDVILVGGKSVPRTFTATKGGANSIIKNTILDFTTKEEDLFIINPSDLL